MPRGYLKFSKSNIVSMLSFTALFLTSVFSSAKDITVFDIRRPISFENNQEMQKDFYINAGVETGLKVGMVITVNRRQTLYDPFQSKSPGDLVVPVGKLKIIHTQENISVARMFEMISRENLPGLEYDAVMVGDRLDMATAKMGKGSDKAYNEGRSNTVVTVIEMNDGDDSVEPSQATSTAVAASVPASLPSVVAASSTNLPANSTTIASPHESSSQSTPTTLPTQGPTL